VPVRLFALPISLVFAACVAPAREPRVAPIDVLAPLAAATTEDAAAPVVAEEAEAEAATEDSGDGGACDAEDDGGQRLLRPARIRAG